MAHMQVRYSDRFVEDLHLPVEVLSFAADQPQVNPSNAINAARLAAAAATASDEVPPRRCLQLGCLSNCCMRACVRA